MSQLKSTLSGNLPQRFNEIVQGIDKMPSEYRAFLMAITILGAEYLSDNIDHDDLRTTITILASVFQPVPYMGRQDTEAPRPAKN